MSSHGADTKKAILYFFWACLFVLAMILLPSYLGLIIAKNEWSVVSFLVLGLTVIALYFSDFRYLIFFTSLFLLLAGSRIQWVAGVFGVLRWVFLITMAVAALSQWIMGKVPSRIRIVDFWAACFFALAFYSTTYSIMPWLTSQRLAAAVLFYWAVFWGVWNYAADKQKIYTIIYELLKASFLVFVLGFTLIVHSNRFFGLFGNPNTIGVLTSILTPLALWGYLCQRKPLSLWLLCVMSIALFLSKSRAGLLATACGVGYFLWQYDRKRQIKIFLWMAFFIGAALLYMEFFGSSFVREYFRLDTLGVAGGRVEAWREVMNLIRKRPLLGYGFGTEDRLFFVFDIIFQISVGAYAHNSYIGLTSQVGLLGAFLFFAPLFYFFASNVYSVYRTPSSDIQWLQAALTASIFGGLVNAVFESWICSVGNPFAFPFWVIVMCSMRLNGFVSRKSSVVFAGRSDA